MPPTKAFASHLARFAFTPSPTKLIPTQSPSPRPTPRQTRSIAQPSIPQTEEVKLLARPRRSTPRAVSRHFSSAPPSASRSTAPGPPDKSDATSAVKAKTDDEYGSDTLAPALKRAKVTKSKKKPARAYADPSVYAHLGGVPDTLEGNLKLVLCGINPGIQSGQTGFHYANPTNLYWKLLFSSGLTDRRLHPSEGRTLPAVGVGCTNLCPRTTAEQSELSKAEMTLGAPVLLSKMERVRPRVLGFVGLGICEVVLKWLHNLPPPPPLPATLAPLKACDTPGDASSVPYWDSPAASPAKRPSKPPKRLKSPRKPAAPKAKPGLQPFFLSFPAPDSLGPRARTYLWAVPSTSARVTSYQFKDQEVLWLAMKAALDGMETGKWVQPEGLVECRWEEVEPHCAVEPEGVAVKAELAAA